VRFNADAPSGISGFVPPTQTLEVIMSSHRLFHPALRALFVFIVVTSASLFAGPPLICHPYAIGNAKSLPAGDDWHGVSKNYDRQNLVRDTLALLTPQTPILVRMETLRRAAIYATAEMRGWDKGAYTTEDRALAAALLNALRERTTDADQTKRALALFDAGFFAETLRQTNMDPKLDGYALMTKAAELRGSDPEVEFALALASVHPRRPEHTEHLARARAAAKEGSLLASNLESHFGKS
jgi:hypothetical protein